MRALGKEGLVPPRWSGESSPSSGGQEQSPRDTHGGSKALLAAAELRLFISNPSKWCPSQPPQGCREAMFITS